MKEKIVRNWYYLSVYAAGALMVIAGVGNWDLRVKMILISASILFLHFFEEFAFPGGFAQMGLKVELGITDPDARKWPLNNLNAMFGNWWYAVVVYLLPLVFPNVGFLNIAIPIFAFVESFGHLLVFNIAIKKIYNPGMITAVFGLLPVSVSYLIQTSTRYTLTDVILAIVWIVLNYWVAFRSPVYKKLGKLSARYGFSETEVAKSRKYLQ